MLSLTCSCSPEEVIVRAFCIATFIAPARYAVKIPAKNNKANRIVWRGAANHHQNWKTDEKSSANLMQNGEASVIAVDQSES